MTESYSLSLTERRCPKFTRDLSPHERQFVAALQRLGFGHVESIKIRDGALALAPSPTLIRVLKFGSAEPRRPRIPPISN